MSWKAKAAAAIPQTGFLRLPQILALIPVSESTWWVGVRKGRFPKAIKLGPKMTAWRAEDISALIASIGGEDE